MLVLLKGINIIKNYYIRKKNKGILDFIDLDLLSDNHTGGVFEYVFGMLFLICFFLWLKGAYNVFGRVFGRRFGKSLGQFVLVKCIIVK